MPVCPLFTSTSPPCAHNEWARDPVYNQTVGPSCVKAPEEVTTVVDADNVAPEDRVQAVVQAGRDE